MDSTDIKDEIRKLFRALLARARKDEVRWQRIDPGKPNVTHKGGYMVKLPSSGLRIDFFSPPSEPDYYIGSLVNEAGKSVQQMLAREVDTADWTLFTSLWQEGYRATTGWDKALADAKKAIDSEDPVGEDDIPF